ncbi:hypothetical protein [Streptomyces alkaliterrae]|uniref:Uncharacterized protein n=1 Tax=Streptomyces alkaliterrae TaxID=2213162 RepID=A0A5P0YLV1_9ACTN|nr:hypothetical protein [Streptomyces alkaliterrae]MBB1260405.1 hypothetical protein [Streptomyces alkaliterrae]MQS01323.1 hypothetical protein [Streptomyces alkaliterrae]
MKLTIDHADGSANISQAASKDCKAQPSATTTSGQLPVPHPGAVLSLEQISVEGVYYGGVRVATCEDGDPLLAIGTHDLRLAIAAWSRYSREFLGENLRDHLTLCPTNCRDTWCTRYGCQTLTNMTDRIWAVFQIPDPTAGPNPECEWLYTEATAATPGAIPVVRV